MKKLLFLSLSILLAACCTSEKNMSVRARLERYDAEIWDKPYVYGDTIPQIILDSLEAIDRKGFSKNNEAYYDLLWTIANDRATMKAESDSVISSAVDYYEDSDDYRNYSRALLYKGIVRYRMDLSDTTIHSCLKKAERVFDENKCRDKRLIALIYTYLGHFNAISDDNERSLEYSRRAMSEYKELNDTNNMVLTRCDMVFTLLSMKNVEEAKHIVDNLVHDKTNVLMVQFNINSCLTTFYKYIKDYGKAVDYAKLDLDNVLYFDKVASYYKIMDLYSKIGDRDSTHKYLELLSFSLTSANNQNEYQYLKKISDLYTSFGYKERANEFLKKAYSSLSDYHKKSYSEKVQELEKRYDVYKKEMEITQIKQESTIVILFLSLFVVIISFVLYLLIQRNKKIIRINEMLQKEDEFLRRESEIRHMTDELVNKLLLVSCKTVPALFAFVDKFTFHDTTIVGGESLSSFNRYKKMKEQIEKQFRKDIEDVITNDTELATNSDFQNLSPQEKIVCFLLEKGYSRENIASILNTSVASIRASISRISQKKSSISAASES